MPQGSAGEKGNPTSIRLLSSLLQRSGCPIIVLPLVTNLKRGITLDCLPAWLRPEGFVLHKFLFDVSFSLSLSFAPWDRP